MRNKAVRLVPLPHWASFRAVVVCAVHRRHLVRVNVTFEFVST